MAEKFYEIRFQKYLFAAQRINFKQFLKIIIRKGITFAIRKGPTKLLRNPGRSGYLALVPFEKLKIFQ